MLGTLIFMTLGCGLAWNNLDQYNSIHTQAEQAMRTQAQRAHDRMESDLQILIQSLQSLGLELEQTPGEDQAALLKARGTLLKKALPSLLELSISSKENSSVSTDTRETIAFASHTNKNGDLELSIEYAAGGAHTASLRGRLDLKHFENILQDLHVNPRVHVGLVDALNRTLFVTPNAHPDTLQNHDSVKKTISFSDFARVHQALSLVVWYDFQPDVQAWQHRVAIELAGFLILGFVMWKGMRYGQLSGLRQEEERNKTREALRYSDERFHLATSNAGIGVWDYNLTTQTLRWDAPMRDIYGVESESEIIDFRQWLSHVIPQDSQRIQTMLNEAHATLQPFETTFGIRKANDKSIRLIQARAMTHLDYTGKPSRMLGVNVDITLQRRFEDALRDAEARFRSAFESAAIGMAIVGLDGQFMQANQALSEIVGYPFQELLTMRFESITHPHDLGRDSQLVEELLEGKCNNYQMEKRCIHKNGQVVWVYLCVSVVRNDMGHVIYFISQVQNITERKRNEAALIEREHFLRTLSECLPGLVSYWGTDLRCHFVNKNHETWTGLSLDKLRGIHMKKLLGEAMFAIDQPYINAALQGHAQRFERRKRKPDGNFADTLVHLIPDVLYGHVEGFFALSTDITDFKAQQRELERMNTKLVERTQQAETANKAKGAFLANMSHEIRTPLNAIMGLIQLIDDTELSVVQRDYVQNIESAAEVLLHVLNDVLDISRVEANKLVIQTERFYLDQVLSKALDLFSYPAREKGLHLHCTKDPACPITLVGDKLRLAQVLNNLLSNALKFTEQGHIHLMVKPIDEGRKIQFLVKDTGIGMSLEQAATLFQPFSQLDNSSSRRYGGAGLGLSICKSLVELMGGVIGIESVEEQGSVFHFTVDVVEPIYKIQAQDSEPLGLTALADSASELLLQGKHFLVADDHKLNRVVASEMIKKWGGAVTLASNGLEAVEICKTEKFDVILMDIQMPEMDGFEATGAIQEMLGESCPPIVAVTASATEQNRKDILAAGMREHLVKPFKKESLIQILLGVQSGLASNTETSGKPVGH